MSISRRLTLFGLGFVALALALFVLAFYALLAAGSGNEQDKRLSSRADQALAAVAEASPEAFLPHRMLAPVDPREALDIFVIVLAADGMPLSSTGEIGGVIPVIPGDVLRTADDTGGVAATVQAEPGLPLRVHVRPWSRPDLGLSGHVVTVQPTRQVQHELRGAGLFLIVAAVLAFLVSGVAIWLVIGRALRPLKQLAALTDEVGATEDLARRLPVPRARDEVRRLSESFNGMMARLQGANGRLAQGLEAQKRFVADASHELRTPLTTIRSNIGFLVNRPDASASDRQEALEDIASESERMSRLVHDLLALAHADAGDHLEKAPVELLPLAEQVGRQARNLHTTREIHAGGDALTVLANEDALRQVLWILVDNAVQHTSDGGHIRIETQHDGEIARLSVSDDGEGIADADLERVFDRFFQADAARSGAGAGLGLAIARRTIEEHDGRISAHNNDGRGVRFGVELPVAAPSRGDRSGAIAPTGRPSADS